MTATARFIRRLLWTSGVNSEPGQPSRKGTTPRSMLHEAGQNLVTEQADAAQHARGIHARPLHAHDQVGDAEPSVIARDLDRKSTRLNSSHLGISYAVFCLKKKNNTA